MPRVLSTLWIIQICACWLFTSTPQVLTAELSKSDFITFQTHMDDVSFPLWHSWGNRNEKCLICDFMQCGTLFVSFLLNSKWTNSNTEIGECRCSSTTGNRMGENIFRIDPEVQVIWYRFLFLMTESASFLFLFSLFNSSIPHIFFNF